MDNNTTLEQQQYIPQTRRQYIARPQQQQQMSPPPPIFDTRQQQQHRRHQQRSNNGSGFVGEDTRSVIDTSSQRNNNNSNNEINNNHKHFGETFRSEVPVSQAFLSAFKMWELVVMILLLVCIPVVSFVITDQMREARLTDIQDTMQGALHATVSAIGSDFSRVAGVTRSFATLFFGALNGTAALPDHTAAANSPSRMVELVPDKFEAFAKRELRLNPAINSFSTRPSNILTQIYPPGSSPRGLDMNVFVPREVEAAAASKTGDYIAGPRMLFQQYPGLVTWSSLWLSTMDPTDTALATPANYFGTVGIVVNLTRFVEKLDVKALLMNHSTVTSSAHPIPVEGAKFALHMLNLETGNDTWFGDLSLPVVTAPRQPNQWERTGIESAQTTVAGVQSTVYFYVDAPLLTSAELCVGIFFGMFLLLIWAIVTHLIIAARLAQIKFKNTENAPPSGSDVCFVCCSVADAAHLWQSSDPKKMLATMSLYSQLVRAVISDFRAFEVSSSHDSFLIATCDLTTAAKISLAVHESMAETTWPLRFHRTCGLLNRISVVSGPATRIDDPITGPTYQGFTVEQARSMAKVVRPGCTLFITAQFDKVSEEVQQWMSVALSITEQQQGQDQGDEGSDDDSSDSENDGSLKQRSNNKNNKNNSHRYRRFMRLPGFVEPVEVSQMTLSSHLESVVPLYHFPESIGENSDVGGGTQSATKASSSSSSPFVGNRRVAGRGAATRHARNLSNNSSSSNNNNHNNNASEDGDDIMMMMNSKRTGSGESEEAVGVDNQQHQLQSPSPAHQQQQTLSSRSNNSSSNNSDLVPNVQQRSPQSNGGFSGQHLTVPQQYQQHRRRSSISMIVGRSNLNVGNRPVPRSDPDREMVVASLPHNIGHANDNEHSRRGRARGARQEEWSLDDNNNSGDVTDPEAYKGPPSWVGTWKA